MDATIEVRLNGDARRVGAGTTVAELVAQLELRPEIVAVELNRTLVKRAEHARTVLREGDRVELVTLVGGG